MQFLSKFAKANFVIKTEQSPQATKDFVLKIIRF
tara:strand:- start:315 stop:416 length:102 start_codon:yes stop_codon:yes gene_type:complete